MIFEITRNGYLLSTDKRKLKLETIHNFLKTSYWAENIPLSIVKTEIKNSLCFGIYLNQEQIGFARVITDYASTAYLCDVFIIDKFRGKGLSKALLKFIMSHPKLKKIRAWKLSTKDAHKLYSKFGFHSPERPERFMEMKIKTW